MPLITSDFEFSDDYPTIEPSLKLDFANARALDPRITFTRASTATYVGANGLIKTAGEDEARFDHDPATGESLGLLIEESRTNLLTYSDLTSGAGGSWWGNGGGTVSQGSNVTAPDGTLTAWNTVYNGASGDGNLFRGGGEVTTTNSTSYTLSVFAKVPSTNAYITGVRLRTFNDNHSAIFNLLTGTVVGTAEGTTTNRIEAYPNGWYRCSITFTSGTDGNQGVQFYLINNASTALNSSGASGEALYLWGAQLEVGSFPTSYIPTSGSTATRAADTATIEGTNFSSWYNKNEGTLVLSTDIGDLTASNQVAVAFEDTSNVSASFIAMGYNAGGGGSGHVGAWYNSSGITSAFKTHNIGVTINTEFRQSFAYKLDDFSSVVNGGAPLTDNSGGITTLIDRVRFGNYHYGGMTSGHIKQFTYYPKRLTNAQLQTLTQ